jgi:ornithine carbamoyltransferase
MRFLHRQEIAKYSPVPVLNALSSLWHPTQILADILTLHEHAELFSSTRSKSPCALAPEDKTKPKLTTPKKMWTPLPELPSTRLTISYVGDSTNVLNDMLVTYPRLGHKLRVASPEAYRAPKAVWDRVEELGCDKSIWWGTDPREAVKDADVVITDTWCVIMCVLAYHTG